VVDNLPSRVLTKRGWEIYLILQGAVTNKGYHRRYVQGLIEQLGDEIEEINYVRLPSPRELLWNILRKIRRDRG
jgi:hypothetical protein